MIETYSLAAGFLTGKYRSPADAAARAAAAPSRKYLDARGLRILDALDAAARTHGGPQVPVAITG